jgi:hypothetical protein
VLVNDESTTYTSATDLAGLPTVKTKISLFRNGIKLRQADFALATGAITITPTTDLPLYQDDVLEVQWIN